MKITDFNAPFGVIAQTRLSLVPRWTIISMSRKQSVAEHSFNVAVITRYLCKKLGLQYVDAVCEAIFHDEDEIYTGDIPSPAKVKEEGDRAKICHPVVKLADLVESYRFARDYCDEPEHIKRWLMINLKNDIVSVLDVNGWGYELIYKLTEE